MRQRFCKVCRGWHETDQPLPDNCAPERIMTRSSLPSPHYINDGIEIQSMHDGQMYTSKSKLRGEYRAHGIEEIGNEKQPPVVKPKADRAAIRNELRKTYAEYNA